MIFDILQFLRFQVLTRQNQMFIFSSFNVKAGWFLFTIATKHSNKLRWKWILNKPHPRKSFHELYIKLWEWESNVLIVSYLLHKLILWSWFTSLFYVLYTKSKIKRISMIIKRRSLTLRRNKTHLTPKQICSVYFEF